MKTKGDSLIRMTERKITTQNHNTYGGLIFLSDYCTDYEGTRNIASRIASDLRFDQQCKKNAENRDRERNRKNA